jgi:hypothetical protein
MNKSRAFPRTQIRASLFGSLLLASLPVTAANFTWKGNTANWNDVSQWVEGLPVSNFSTDLFFLGSGALSYTATNNFSTPFTLNSITLNSSSTAASTVAGNALEFVTDTGSPTPPSITQSGSGAFTIATPFNANDPLTLGGNGTGLVTLSGNITGFGGLTFTGANWRITDATNAFSGVLGINTGALVELAAAGTGPQGVNLSPGIGLTGGSTITIDGGTLKLTTSGSVTTAGGASLTLGGRVVTFGTNGGTLDLRNSNPAAATIHAGSIGYNNGTAIVGGGDLGVTLNNDAAHPAVIQFNGGQLGLSEITTANVTNGNWSLGGSMLRFASLSGGGPLRIELTNGAAHLVNGGYGTGPTAPITIRGVVGGDPTSGPNGTVNTGITLTAGRMMFDNQRVTYANGITLEGALQIVPANRATAMDGNITVASNGYVAFQGRGTGTALGDVINAPGNGAAGHNVLWIGEDATTTLTIQTGGIVAFDGRLRSEQNNAHGVLLGGNAILNAGATLRIQQSISNFSALSGGLTTNQNEGDIILRGTITGQGSTASESVLDIKLPAPDASGSTATGVPVPLTAAPAQGSRPFAGLVAETTNTIIINGTGFGGLRINATARPDRLFSATGTPGGAAIPDPTPNLTKINAYLTGERLAAVSGTGGYLTIAPAGAAYTFPASGVWADPDIGLKVVDSNSAGPDVSLAGLGSWNKNLAVDSGATLESRR